MDYDSLLPSKTGPQRIRKFDLKKRLIGILGISAMVYLALTALRNTGFPAFKRILAAPCRGGNRTFGTGQGLPSHYTLPSGDKIPSVALGKSSGGVMVSATV